MISRVAAFAVAFAMPAVAIAQTTSTPLPAAPVMEPLYPTRATAEQPRPRTEMRRSTYRAEVPTRTASVIAPAAAVPVRAALAPVPVATEPSPVAPVIASRPNWVAAGALLPPNTDVLVRLDETVSSKKAKVGNGFRLSVAQDVIMGGAIVIPRGTPAFGQIAYRTGKGAFGKSAKMEITIDRLELGGRSVPLTGRFRQEGEGNTGATVGAAVAAGLIAAAFVTGRSAVFEAGREFRVSTREALPFAVAGDAPAPVRAASMTGAAER